MRCIQFLILVVVVGASRSAAAGSIVAAVVARANYQKVCEELLRGGATAATDEYREKYRLRYDPFLNSAERDRFQNWIDASFGPDLFGGVTGLSTTNLFLGRGKSVGELRFSYRTGGPLDFAKRATPFWSLPLSEHFWSFASGGQLRENWRGTPADIIDALRALESVDLFVESTGGPRIEIHGNDPKFFKYFRRVLGRKYRGLRWHETFTEQKAALSLSFQKTGSDQSKSLEIFKDLGLQGGLSLTPLELKPALVW